MAFHNNKNNNNPIDEALDLLDLRPPKTTREDIEQAFRVAAKKYHPDRSKTNATANATAADSVKFRKCLQARELLLDRYDHAAHRRREPNFRTEARTPAPPEGDHYTFNPRYGYSFGYHFQRMKKDTSGSGNAIFVQGLGGFPSKKLRVFTTRSKLQLHFATAVLILGMGFYDGYTKKKLPQQQQAAEKS